MGTGKLLHLRTTRPARVGRISSRSAEVVSRFGLVHAERQEMLTDVAVRLVPGRIVAFVGPSGSGKTTALHQIESRFAAACHVDRIGFPRDAALVDAVLPEGDLADALHLLSSCALGEAALWLRRFDELSEGEQFRARLARAMGIVSVTGSGAAPLLIDEFAARLHRRASRAVAYNLRRLTDRRKLAVVVAANSDQLLGDLQPDVVVRLAPKRAITVEHRRCKRHRFSLLRRLRIGAGAKHDYASFADMHYRDADELGFVDKVFVLRDADEPVGVLVYAFAPAELALRNRATDGRFRGNLARLNRELRIVRRMVLHPDLRGCGIAHGFLRKTLPRVGTRYVECLASMGAVNPVFERAGMQRIGECALPSRTAAIGEHLRRMDVDPFASDFETSVCRKPEVRALVGEAVARWYRATTGGGEHRVARQSPQLLARLFRAQVGSRPVYYLWTRDRKK